MSPPTALLQLLMATGGVLACSALLLLVFLGLGLVLQTAWRPGHHRIFEPDTVCWLGWGIWLLGLQVWHLFCPTGWGFAALACAGGLCGLGIYRRELRRLAVHVWSEHRAFVVVVLLLALWLSNLALAPPKNGDSGLYHFSSVRWAAKFADVPGLANLQGRLGFTSSYFLYAASLELGPWVGRSFHLANVSLFLLPLARGLWSLRKVFRQEDWRKARVLFDLVMLFPILEKLWGEQFLTSPTPDLPVFLLGIVGSSLLFGLLEGPNCSALEGQYRALAIALLSVMGLTIKPSFAAFALSAAPLALLIQARDQKHRGETIGRRPWVILALTWLIALVPFLTRSVVLSGYPLYPFPKIGFATDWRVPADLATDDYNWVRSWARKPLAHWRDVLGNWGWLPGWAHDIVSKRYTAFQVCLPLSLAAISGLALGAMHCRGVTRSSSGRLVGLALLPTAVSLVYWFLTAPAPRFAGSSFWVLGCGSAVLVLTRLDNAKWITGLRSVALLVVVMASAAFVFKCWQKGVLTVGPGSDVGFHPVPQTPLKICRTLSGLELNVPATTEWCWDAPLPCTPYPNPLLRLRKVGDLAAGFTLTGPEAAAPRNNKSSVDTQ